MNDVMYQKLGITVHQLAQDLMSREVGDRIPSISEYHEQFQVARGTVQNALQYLKSEKAIRLRNRGTLGTLIEDIDYYKLQSVSLIKSMLGIMPLPYSAGYQGMATALYEALSQMDCNLAYVRGAETRIRMVEQGVYHFAICSLAAAKKMIENKAEVKIALNFGRESYLARHVLLLREKGNDIEDGMRIAYDHASLDQRLLVDMLTSTKKNIRYVDIRAHQTLEAITANKIDAGTWNYDEIVENKYENIHMVFLDDKEEMDTFNSAVMVVRKNEEAVEQILNKYIQVAEIRKVQAEVKEGKRVPNY